MRVAVVLLGLALVCELVFCFSFPTHSHSAGESCRERGCPVKGRPNRYALSW